MKKEVRKEHWGNAGRIIELSPAKILVMVHTQSNSATIFQADLRIYAYYFKLATSAILIAN